MIVEIIAKVEEMESNKSLTSNSFYHVYVAPNDVDAVLPQNYHGKYYSNYWFVIYLVSTLIHNIYAFLDSMLYIDGRRRYLDFIAHLEKEEQSLGNN